CSLPGGNLCATVRVFVQQRLTIEWPWRPRCHSCRLCLDWIERRPHIAGALGAAITKRLFDLGWMERVTRSHALIVPPAGRRPLQQPFGVNVSEPADRGSR